MGIKEIMKPAKDGIKLNISFISDLHFDTKHPTPKDLYDRTGAGFQDMSASECPVDLMAVPGDTTSEGNDVNWQMLLDTLAVAKPARKILLTIGNHDTWGEEAFAKYFEYCGIVMSQAPDKVYFTREFKGYSFICLGSERNAGCAAYVSAEQVAFLDAELKKATAGGKPAFVLFHQSINQKHGLPATWSSQFDPTRDPLEGGIGERSDEIEAVLKKYKNVFYISGHTHMGMCGEKTLKEKGYASFEEDGGVHLLNLPAYNCGNFHGEYNNLGVGVQAEVYDDCVILRVRDYILGEWVPELDHVYPLV